jgi:ribosomal protein L22
MADERDKGEEVEPEAQADAAPEESEKQDAGGAEPQASAEPAEAKPRRSRRKKADAEAADEPSAEADEPSADEVAEQARPEELDKPKRRRRGAAEVSGEASKAPARRDADGQVIVRAKARYVRCAPRKARLVVDHIRGKSVDDARAILIHTPRAASRDVLKLLDSAIANAENNHELVADELKIHQVFVDEGPTLKRFRPRALGRATRVRKRTSHMTILLTPKE